MFYLTAKRVNFKNRVYYCKDGGKNFEGEPSFTGGFGSKRIATALTSLALAQRILSWFNHPLCPYSDFKIIPTDEDP